MVKSKNRTAHNQAEKAHIFGIKDPKFQCYESLRGVAIKYLKKQKTFFEECCCQKVKILITNRLN